MVPGSSRNWIAVNAVQNQQTNRTTKLEEEITIMKTQLLKTIMVPLVVACGLVTMVAPTATGQGRAGGKLEGAWNVTAPVAIPA